MNFLYFIGGMMLFWSVLLTIIHRVEKRMVWTYGPLQPDIPYPDPTMYGREQVQDAQRLGFKFLGWTKDMKGSTYKCSYAMLVSPERDIFAIVGVGTILKLQLQATWLHSPTSDGRNYYSVDHQTGVQTDLSGHWQNQLLPNAKLPALMNAHRAWLQKQGVFPRTFTPGREYEEFRALREEHFRVMEQAGLIYYTDAANTHVRYTWLGAAKSAVAGYFKGMGRQITKGKSETRRA